MSVTDYDPVKNTCTHTGADFKFVQMIEQVPQWMLDYAAQRRRAIITELRALDKLLGRRQTIPRKER